MASENVISYKDTDTGRNLKLDTANGYVYDLAGNQVSRWTPTNSEYCGVIADYVYAEEFLAPMRHVLKKYDAERAACVANDTEWLAANTSGDGRLVTMDLAIGDVHQSTPVNNFAIGYQNEDPVADIVAPPMLVQNAGGKFYAFAKEDAFQRGGPIIAAPGARVAEIAPRVQNTPFATVEYGLGGFVATEIEASADPGLQVRQATANRIMTVMRLEREIRVMNLLSTSANWDSNLVVTLGAGFQWNGGVNSNPIADIQTRLEKSWGAGSALVISERLWHSFLRNAAVQAYLRPAVGANALPTLQQVREQFGLPPIYVARMKYINTAGALDYVWGNSAFIVRQPTNMPPRNQNDVTTALTLRWNITNVPDGTANNGFIVREFFVQDRGTLGGNKVVISHNDIEVMTSKYVGGMIAAAYQ